jgi:hypothetical protein
VSTIIYNFCKDLDCEIENKGKEILITIKGNEEKLEKLEKKLNALKEFCQNFCGEEGCC